jgi:hypothetical protein
VGCTRRWSRSLLQLRVEQRRVEPRDHLALSDDAVEIGAEPLNVARHLAADLDRGDRLQRPGRAHRVDDLAAADRRRVDLDLGAVAPGVQNPRADADGDQDRQRNEGSLHAGVTQPLGLPFTRSTMSQSSHTLTSDGS